MDLSGIGVWSSQLRYGDPAEAAEAAAELEELGFEALWIPTSVGRSSTPSITCWRRPNGR